jgi:leucyl aminopeptidase (aminopeptidase T)
MGHLLHAHARGHPFVFNLPTEEVFTTPDYRRTEGVVQITRPLGTRGGVVEGLTLRFERGEIVEVDAARGANVMRAQLAVDPGAARLGEVALVDGASPVGQSGITFGDAPSTRMPPVTSLWGLRIRKPCLISPTPGTTNLRWDSIAPTYTRTP